MQAQTVQTWSARHLFVRRRLVNVCTSDLLFLMVVTTQQTLEEAARFSGLHTSPFSKMWQAHSTVAVYTLESLSKKQAKQVAQARQKWRALPWQMAILGESTLQRRASLPPENATTFKQGPGFVVGHPGTTIVLLLHALLLPLRPIPFYRRRSWRERKREYRPEHDLVVESLQQGQLAEYIGSYAPREVVVLTDSGSENTKSQKAIAAKQGHGLSALGKTRSVQSVRLSRTTPKSQQGSPVAPFFRHHRWLKWPTMRLPTHGTKRKRMAFRTRDTMG
jgi:hypothetical protein